MATKKLPDLVNITSVESSDLLLVRDITDGVDKKSTVDVLLASRVGGSTGSTSNFVLIADGVGGKILKAATHVVIDDTGKLSVGSDTADAMVDITCKDVNTLGLKIKAAENQTEDLMKIVSYDETTLFVINSAGDLGVTITSPNEPLHVQSDFDGNRAIRMGNESDGTLAVGRFIIDVLGGSTFLAGYGSNFTTSGSKRANSASLIANAAMAGGLSLVARHSTTGHLRFYAGGNEDVNLKMIIQADGKTGIGSDTLNAMLDITCKDVSTSALKISALEDQASDLLLIEDFEDNELITITSGGKLHLEKGVRSVSNQWGDSISTWPYQSGVPEHQITNNAGYYDWDGNPSGNNLFYDTVNSPFTQADADNHNWIVINSGPYKGAKAEIETFIDSSNVQVFVVGNCWNSDLSGVNYTIHKSPQIIAGDCYNTHIHSGNLGRITISNSLGSFLGDVILEIQGKMGKDNADTVHIHHDSNGKDRSDALQMFYKTGALGVDEYNHAIHINLDDSEATGGHLDGVVVETTSVGSDVREAFHAGPGFTNAFSVAGAESCDPGYGYEITSTTVVDRVNSGGAGDDAFVNNAVNQTLFDNDNDYILIGCDEKFEIIEAIFGTISSKNLLFDFYYSKAGGNWTQFYPSDGTIGSTKSGLITFSAPADWTKDDQAEVNEDITEAYYIKIQRTYSFVVSQLPIESYFKVYQSIAGDTGMLIKGNGVVKLPYLSDYTPSENGDMWMQSDGLHIYYNGVEKVVAGV